jgi:general secretion pathway protein K
LEEIEELLLVKGMTPDIFYGTYEREPVGQQRLVPTGGLNDCLSVFGSNAQIDANAASPAVLATLGLSPEAVAAFIERRRAVPFRNLGEITAFLQGAGPGVGRLRAGGNSIFTLRATARLRLASGQLSDMRRSVAAMVKFMPAGYDAPYHILRWYDTAWSH